MKIQPRFLTNALITIVLVGYLYSFVKTESNWPFVAFDMYAMVQADSRIYHNVYGELESGGVVRISTRQIPLFQYKRADVFNYLDRMETIDPDKYAYFLTHLRGQINADKKSNLFVKIWIEKHTGGVPDVIREMKRDSK